MQHNTRENRSKTRIDFTDPKVLDQIASILLNHTPIAYIILDKKLRIHFFNDFYTKIRKLERNDILGNYCYNITNNGVPCRECAVQAAIAKKERQFVSRKDYLPDGSFCCVDDYAIPLVNAVGDFNYILEVIIDRTAERRLQENNDNLYVGMIEALISILDKKDPYTSDHSRDVTKIAVKLARHIGLGDAEVQDIRLASLLHDIGKIYIPDAIINKPGSLTEDEYRIIKRHPTETLNMLANLSQLTEVRLIAGHHHERWDGRGYPDRLAGEEIPLGSRIISIADTYDAMTSNRSYRNALPHEKAVEEILANAGSQFDPNLVRRFADMVASESDPRERLLTEKIDARYRRQNRNSVKIERHLQDSAGNSTHIFHDDVTKFFSSKTFVRAIMENSPCFYTIIDENFNILFASESMLRESGLPPEKIYDMHCYEIAQNGKPCFGDEKGAAACAAMRAFQTGAPQEGKIEYRFKGRTWLCDVYANPLTLRDVNGEEVKCVLQIILDRTREVRARHSFESDVKTLLNTLVQVITNMDESVTAGSEDIIESCTNFSEYLSNIGDALKNYSRASAMRAEKSQGHSQRAR